MQIIQSMLICYGIYLSRLCPLWRKLRSRLISSWTRSLVSLRILVNFAAKGGITPAGVFTSLGSSLVIKVGRKRGARQPRDSHVDYRPYRENPSSLSSPRFSIPGHLLSVMLSRARADPYGN